MKSLHRLPMQYDPQRLLADLARAEQAGQYHEHYNAYAGEAEGGWSSIPLFSRGGKIDPSASLDYGRYVRQVGKPPPFQKTEILKQCPYFEQILDSFQCSKRRVRLLRLAPGARIYRHRDPGESWAGGRPRLHIPIVTHDEVYFFHEGQRVIMRPGELWYCDFSRYHWVENRSPIARVHLMCELVVNDWLRQQFPAESLVERAGNWTYRTRVETGWKLAKYGRAIGQRLNDLRTTSSSAPRES
jgi:hypothetical protein